MMNSKVLATDYRYFFNSEEIKLDDFLSKMESGYYSIHYVNNVYKTGSYVYFDRIDQRFKKEGEDLTL